MPRYTVIRIEEATRNLLNKMKDVHVFDEQIGMIALIPINEEDGCVLVITEKYFRTLFPEANSQLTFQQV